MYILEVSYGCPSQKYPQNGVFQMDQAIALHDIGNKVVFSAIDVRSIRKWRKWGIYEHTHAGIPVMEFNYPIGPIFPQIREKICEVGFSLIIRRVISKYGKPDIVHVHFGDTAQSIVKTCKSINIPFVLTEHSSGLNCDNLSVKKVANYQYVYQNADAVIAVSSQLAKRIEQYIGIKPTIIPNIIDFNTFFVAPLKHDTFRFLSAGNLIQNKGFDILLDAFKMIIDRGIHAELVIMGDGFEREALVKQTYKLHLMNLVRFTGSYKRNEFAEMLSISDVFVLASRGETFGVVYAEAMACGLPVVATRCGGPEDFINCTNGVLVDVEDAYELSVAMQNMCLDAKKFDAIKISKEIEMYCSAKNIANRIQSVMKTSIKERL